MRISTQFSNAAVVSLLVRFHFREDGILAVLIRSIIVMFFDDIIGIFDIFINTPGSNKRSEFFLYWPVSQCNHALFPLHGLFLCTCSLWLLRPPL